MNASMDSMWLAVAACNPVRRHAPRRAVSRELADAATALRGFIPADATLDDVRRALLGMGFAWTGAGELTYRPNARLLDEFDELIDAFGRDTPAALLFTAIA